KGMLVQSKWDRSLRRSADRRDLEQQVKNMTDRSPEASYVWVYERTGVGVYPARALQRPFRRPQTRMTIGELIAAGVRCTEGDFAIGRRVAPPLVESLNAVMTQIAAKSSLSFTVSEADDH